DAHDLLLGRHALPAQNLHAAVDDAPFSFGTHDLGTAGFEVAALTLVEQPRRVPDVQAGGVDIHVVVGEHEADTLVFGQGLAKCMATAGVFHRRIVGTACLAQPAHAVRQARRGQTHLRVA